MIAKCSAWNGTPTSPSPMLRELFKGWSGEEYKGQMVEAGGLLYCESVSQEHGVAGACALTAAAVTCRESAQDSLNTKSQMEGGLVRPHPSLPGKLRADWGRKSLSSGM